MYNNNDDFIKLAGFVDNEEEKLILSKFEKVKYSYDEEMFMFIVAYKRYVKIFHPIYNFLFGKYVYSKMVNTFEKVNKKKFFTGNKASYFENITKEASILHLKSILSVNISMFPELKPIVSKYIK
jgi:hypothetical protein